MNHKLIDRTRRLTPADRILEVRIREKRIPELQIRRVGGRILWVDWTKKIE